MGTSDYIVPTEESDPDAYLRISREQLWLWLHRGCLELADRPHTSEIGEMIEYLLHACRRAGSVELGNSLMVLWRLHEAGQDEPAFRSLFALSIQAGVAGIAAKTAGDMR